MNLKLVKASTEYKEQICAMLDEWYATGEKIIPYAVSILLLLGFVIQTQV